MSRVGERLRQAIEAHETLSIRQFQKTIDETGVDGTSYATVHGYINPEGTTEPSLDFLEEAAKILGVRREWLVLDQGPMTEVEGVTEAPDDVEHGQHVIWKGLREEWPDLFNPLPRAVQAELLQVLSRYVLACADGGEVPRDDEDLERVVELGGYLLWQLWAPMRAWNFPEHPTGEIRSYHGMKLMLGALEHFLPDRRSGEPIAAFRDSDEFDEWQRQMR